MAKRKDRPGSAAGAHSQAARERAPTRTFTGVDEPSWELSEVGSPGPLVIRFVGPTRTEEVPQFLAALTRRMPPEGANIVFDLRELHGHNPETKRPFKQWLVQHKHQISQVTVVVPKSAAIVKLVTAVLSLASGVPIKIRDDSAIEGVLPGARIM